MAINYTQSAVVFTVLLAMTGCPSDPDARASGDTGVVVPSGPGTTGPSGPGSNSNSGADSGAADTTTGTDSAATSDDGDDHDPGSPVLFDIGAIPDVPDSDGTFQGIPETCDEAKAAQSTVGCSFRGNRMENFAEYDASIVVGNVSEDEATLVQLYFTTGAGEVAQGAAVSVGPLQSHEFVLSQPNTPGSVTVNREAGTYRVESDLPMVAYQHSPISAVASNDSSMLIPDHALGQFYIVASYQTTVSGNLSAFNVIGVHDGTLVEWTPRNQTSAGGGIAAVPPFGLGSAIVDQNDLLQVVAATDVSGTIIETSEPAWVVGTNPCANIPNGVTFCDHIEELLIPVEYWGTQYVGAHAPNRGNERYWWRVYSGADDVTVSVSPAQPGFPVQLDRGEFYEFNTYDHVIFEGTGGFMPVQYLEGQDGGAGTGDPASYQMVPTEQFLPRYVFVTGVGYNQNFVQVTRPTDGADVFVDGILVGGYTTIGDFEVSDWPVAEGPHSADSDAPFGIIQVGYTGVTSYAYPGGLALGFINPNPAG